MIWMCFHLPDDPKERENYVGFMLRSAKGVPAEWLVSKGISSDFLVCLQQS
jgi:hypothetical protein